MKRAALAALLLCVGFAGGALLPRDKALAVLRRLAESANSASDAASVSAEAELRKQRELAGGKPSFEKEIESALLPLRISGFRVGANLPVAKFAGGIAAIGNDVIVVDRLGHFFLFREGQWSALPVPAVPMNIEAFLRVKTLTNENFRVHDVEYLPEDHALAVSHEAFDEETKQTRLTVSLIGFDRQQMTSAGEWRTLWRGDVVSGDQPPASPGAGRLVRAPQGRLYLTTIDYIPDDFAHPKPELAQDPASNFGKILEIEMASGRAEVVSLGHRNPQGLVLTRAGDLFSSEHGPGGGDEVNLITRGENYGWPKVTLGTEYDSYQWPATAPIGRHDGFTPPAFAWQPAVAPSNLIELHGFHERWDGDLLVGSLKAATLFRLRQEGNRVLYSEPIYIGERIRDLVQLADGTIALWTDSAHLLLVGVNMAILEGRKRVTEPHAAAFAHCVKCHHFGPTEPTHLAPTLSNLLGRPVASDNFTGYSTGLKAVGGVWTRERLRAFLNDPAAFAEGTTMPKSDLQPSDIDAILSELQRHAQK